MKPFAQRGRLPVVVGRRGAPLVAAENTPASFVAAARAGATWVEVDVRRSADDVAVVSCGPCTPDGLPLVTQTTRELRGKGVWPLVRIMDALPDGVGVALELQNVPGEPDYDERQLLVDLVADVLAVTRVPRPLLLSSFNPLTLDAVRHTLTDVPVGLLHGAAVSIADALDIATQLSARVLCPHVDSPALDAADIHAVHEAGLTVLVWTVDVPARAVALAQAGVDAICTNDPRGILLALREWVDPVAG